VRPVPRHEEYLIRILHQRAGLGRRAGHDGRIQEREVLVGVVRRLRRPRGQPLEGVRAGVDVTACESNQTERR
jgi:hypothetical protein